MSSDTGFAFVLGAAVGAAAALLLAPKSGEELRAELMREARIERAHIQKEYEKTTDELHRRLDQVTEDVRAALEGIDSKGEAFEA